MKKGWQRGFSLLVVVIMLVGMVPVSALAKETNTSGSTVVQQNSNSVASTGAQSIGTQTVNVSETITTLAYQGFQYREETGGITLISYSGKLPDTKILEIPEKINEKTVIKIEKEAFKDNTELKEAIIPKGVTGIDQTAFDGCTSLEKITVSRDNPVYTDEQGKLCLKETKELIAEPLNWKAVTVAATEATEKGPVAATEQVTTVPPLIDAPTVLQTGPSEKDYTWADNDGSICITAYTGSLTEITIPETINGKSVTSIGPNTFKNKIQLKKIILGSNVLTIGDSAFSGCSSLTEITLNAGLKTIGQNVFAGCNVLTDIDIPASVTAIDESAFTHCTTLTAINVAEDNPSYQSRDGVLYNKAGTILIRCPQGSPILKEQTVKITTDTSQTVNSLETSIEEQSTEVIESTVDGETADIQETSADLQGTANGIDPEEYTPPVEDAPDAVTIPEGVVSIGSDAFAGCGLTVVSLPESVTAIGDNAFENTLKTVYGVTGSYAETYAAANHLAFISVNLGITALAVKSFITDKVSGQYINTSIKLTATGTGGQAPYQYKFYYKLGTAVTIIKNYATTNTATFKPAKAGTYALYVAIKDTKGAIATKAIGSYKIYEKPSVKSFTTDKVSGQYINTSIKLTAAGTGGQAPYQYKFYYKLGTVTTVIKNYATTNTATFKPAKAGTYALYAEIKDAKGTIVTKAIGNYKIYEKPSVKSFTTDKATGQYINTSIKLTAAGTGGQAPYQYKFYYKLGTATTIIKNYATTNTAIFKPTQPGTYTLYAEIKDAKGTTATKSITSYVVKKHEVKEVNCSYRTHVENIGWQDWKTKGETSGTSGQSLRLEGIQIKVNNMGYNVGVQYQTHVENIGWQDWKSDGTMSGTSGQSLRLEAIRIKLTGTEASKCDIYYRVHAQNFGWMGWAKNGESAGTEGYAYRLEAIQIVVVPKGQGAPGSTENAYKKYVEPPYKQAYRNLVTQAYRELMNSSYIYKSKYNYYYSIFDMDSNGVPELLLSKGTCAADETFFIYTFENNQVRFVGNFHSGHTVLYGKKSSTSGQLITVYGQMLVQRVHELNLVNGTICSNLINSENINSIADYYKTDYPVPYKYTFDLSLLN